MKRFLFISLLMIALQSCGDDGSEDCNEVICTRIFVQIGAEIRNADGSAARIDRTETTNQEGEVLLSTSAGLTGSFYAILTDEQFDQVSGQGTELTFRGWIGAEEVFSESYVIGRDCCHIRLESGLETIMLDQ